MKGFCRLSKNYYGQSLRRESPRRGPRVPASDAEVAFQCQTQTSRPLSDAEVAFQSLTRRSPDADLASFVRRESHQTRTSHPLSNSSLSSSAFQHRREPASSASQHQSKVGVQRETCISAITDSHKLDQLHLISLHIMGNNFSLWRDLRGWSHSSHYGEI